MCVTGLFARSENRIALLPPISIHPFALPLRAVDHFGIRNKKSQNESGWLVKTTYVSVVSSSYINK